MCLRDACCQTGNLQSCIFPRGRVDARAARGNYRNDIIREAYTTSGIIPHRVEVRDRKKKRSEASWRAITRYIFARAQKKNCQAIAQNTRY